MLPRAVIIAVIIKRRRMIRKKHREHWVHPMFCDRLFQGKFYTLDLKLLDYPKKFFSFYRMSISSFNEVVRLIGPSIAKEDTSLRRAIPVEERLSVTLR
jgi:hypothetical protein